MTSARDAILNTVRGGLGVSGSDNSRSDAVATRLKAHPASTVPARAKGTDEELVKSFADMLQSQKATLDWVSHADDIPQAVAGYLRDQNLPARARMGDDKMLEALPWDAAAALEIARGPAEASDDVGITHALTAAAETGTLVMTSGAENPTTLNFLPETHIAVIRRGNIVGSYEEVWARLRARYGEGTLPRNVNMISGPSRTADIEQTMVMGAHGPRRLHVIVVD